MASSETQIANLALGYCVGGQVRLESLTEDRTEARWAREFYPHARDFVTELNLWRYCKRTLALEETTNDRDSDYAYAYTRPSDCFSLHHILPTYGAFDPRNPIRFDCEGDVIYTDEAGARGVYCRQVTDVTKFPPSIDIAIAWYLGHMLVQPLRQENRLLTTTAQGFNDAINHAITRGAVEALYIPTTDEAMVNWHAGR